jgi:drug/metabolite transporter (DMT)-like permease
MAAISEDKREPGRKMSAVGPAFAIIVGSMRKKGTAGRSWLYAVVLVAVTAVWGWTFVVVQDAIAIYGVVPFLAGRFVLAGAALTPVYARTLTRRTLLVGCAIGVVLAAAYLFQTAGLLFTTPTNTGFITACSSSSRRLPTDCCSGPTSPDR